MTPPSATASTTTAGNGATGTIAPPHNLEAEQSVLGAILLSERAMYPLLIDEHLQPDDFYRERHATIYSGMLALYHAGEPIDVLTVSEHLRQSGRLEEVGGQASIDGLAGAVPAAGNARHYARIVRDNALMRRLLTTTYEIQASVTDRRAPPRELVEQAERAVLEVAHEDHRKDFAPVADVLAVELDKLQRLSQSGAALTGTPSGFTDLDRITGGFQPGNLIVIAARPSMGKSSLVANIAENASLDHQQPVALFSLEMSESELAQRFIASQARMNGDDLRKGRVSAERWPKIVEASGRLARAPLYIDDSSDIGILEVRAKARRLHQQHNLGLIIIDYLHLMRPDHRVESRVQQVGEMSRGLKILARELEVPVIAISQLSRAVEARHPPIPQLSDLRESGQIEQDSDVVAFLYRPEYYARRDGTDDSEPVEREGEADLIVSKHRNGGLGTVKLTFRKEYPKFMNYVSPDRMA
jgi:replicative DNA helicase